ncbi:MAG: von Willebrand factor type A domain-containing protein [Planctomycetia bacterium]|nr:von Willebrand factor type A domain-containing protein [Planctomycetia bacterium]
MTKPGRLTDHEIDARLADVRVPGRFLVKLRLIADGPQALGFNDEAADSERGSADASVPSVDAAESGSWNDVLTGMLRDVPVPDVFLDSLRASAGSPADEVSPARAKLPKARPLPAAAVAAPAAEAVCDESLDRLLRNVPLPEGLSARWKGLVARRRASRVRQWASAAAIVAAATVMYVGGFWVEAVLSAPAGAVAVEVFPAAALALADEEPLLTEVAIGPLAELDANRQPGGDGEQRPPRELEPAPRLLATALGAPSRPMDMYSPAQLWRAARRLDRGSFVAGGVIDERDWLPELARRPSGTPATIAPPSLSGADWRFYLRHDEWPAVPLSGSLDGPGGSLRIPLRVATDSFELARRYVAEGDLPPAKQVRKEEFLAAVDYRYPPPEDEALGLRTAGGPSPFGDPGQYLVQVGVQAADAQVDSRRDPADLVVVLDVSGSMRWGGRLGMTAQALGQALREMRRGDLASLVAFGDDVQVLVEDATLDDRDLLRAAAAAMRPEGSTDLSGGLHTGYALMKPRGRVTWVSTDNLSQPPIQRRLARSVVLITDGGVLTPAAADALGALVEQARSVGDIRLTIVDVNPTGATPRKEYERLAQAGGGKAVTAGTVHEVRAAIVEALTGRPQVAARSVELQITFNPIYVESYRLIGHDETRGKAAEDRDWEPATFVAGQSATALYEVKLRPVVPDTHAAPYLLRDTVATATLRWEEPDGAKRTATQRISQLQLARTYLETPLSLQFAALVAETAEVLRGSQFAKRSSLAAVLEQARRAGAELRQRPEFAEFTAFVEAAGGKPKRGGSK